MERSRRVTSAWEHARHWPLIATLALAACTRTTGEQGPQGEPGPQGPAGLQGPKGDKGDTGAVGAAGAPGVKGDTGAQGDVGPQGTQGIAGSKGDTGDVGPIGPTGAQGAQGTEGALRIYGDGSAGPFTLGPTIVLDATTPTGVAALPDGANLQFTSLTVNGTLIVPTGTVIRVTGDFTLSGVIGVASGADDSGNGEPHPGIARSAAGDPSGGKGLSSLTAHRLLHPELGGGSGSRVSPLVAGSQGGGSITILVQGSVRITTGGNLSAPGTPGHVAAAATVGAGGGGGGVVVVVGKIGIQIAGTIQANGGNGGTAGVITGASEGKGGGGGGGGGIIHLLSAGPISVTGTLAANGGAAGTSTPPQSSTVTAAGGGGGGSGGNGGVGGVTGATSATAGSTGWIFQTVVPAPENLFL